MMDPAAWTPQRWQLRELLCSLFPLAADVQALVVDLSDLVSHLDRRIPIDASQQEIINRLLMTVGTTTIWRFLNEHRADILNDDAVQTMLERFRQTVNAQEPVAIEGLIPDEDSPTRATLLHSINISGNISGSVVVTGSSNHISMGRLTTRREKGR